MRNSFTNIRRMMALAGAAALTSGAFAFTFDAQILIERALNSPNLTVKYDGANAALVELRINGESFATRSVSSTVSKGETSFTLTVTDLKDGENEIEIRLYDKTGKVIDTQKQTIYTDEANRGPVYISGPKQGATVKGPVEIKCGFGKEMKNVFVSFFVDGDHKAMTNVAPYAYVWDTEKESNGWHTVEAWVVDETTNTYKTKQVRVFVNNPGGRTERKGLGGDPSVAKGTTKPSVSDATSELKGANTGNAIADGSLRTNVVEPKVKVADVKPKVTSTEVKVKPNVEAKQTVKTVKTTVNKSTPVANTPVVSKTQNPVELSPTVAKLKPSVDQSMSGAKSPQLEDSIAMGPQDMMPTGLRVAGGKSSSSNPGFNVTATARRYSITNGTRLEGVSTFAVLLNNRYVEFDVQPRVDDGIPMTPFRHLLEKAGGEVKWLSDLKAVDALTEGRKIWFRVGDANAKINDQVFKLELAPYIDRGRTIVPLSFMKDALGVKIDFDPATGHVLITKQ